MQNLTSLLQNLISQINKLKWSNNSRIISIMISVPSKGDPSVLERIIYVSPSMIPSRSANSIHVLNQCNALAKYSSEVILFCASMNEWREPDIISKFYGMELDAKLTIKKIYVRSLKALQIKIAIMALYYVVKNTGNNNLIISRNIYMSFLLTILGFYHIFETHGPEPDRIKRFAQNIIMRRNKVICISQRLSDILKIQCNSDIDIKVLHDAASNFKKVEVSHHLCGRSRFRVGYFGHLYPGRGIQIIEGLASQFPEIDFYVVGGDDASITRLRRRISSTNLKVVGYLRYSEARSLMCAMDVLLMPYQHKVSIGIENSDTSQWMSPLKMFEYLSANKPIISSNLPVLKEVLEDENNALLVECDDLFSWGKALQVLKDNSRLRDKIARNSYQLYLRQYTWSERARQIISFAKK